MSESIFSYLTSYIPTDKRESKEDYLTQMFAWMLNNIEEYAREYVLFLSKKNDKIVCPSKNEMNISDSGRTGYFSYYYPSFRRKRI